LHIDPRVVDVFVRELFTERFCRRDSKPKINEQLISNDKKDSIKRIRRIRKMEESLWRNISKYFLHGILFSVLYLAMLFVWAFLFGLLIVVGAFIGFIIGFIVLFFILGGLNSILASIIWSISTRTAWTSLLGHGFILFIALIIAHIPAIVINLVVPDLTTTIVLFIVNAFIDGFIAKNVAGMWKD